MRTDRGRQGGRRLRGPRLAALLVLALLGAFLAWRVVQAGAAAALVRANPYAAARLSPNDADVRIALAMAEFRLRGGRVSKELQAGATDALQTNALAEEPFLLAGIAALARGDEATGEQLLIEARRRNPRSRMTRLVLLDRFARTGRTSDAIGEIAAINRLVSRAATVLVPELARMAMDPKQRQSVKLALRDDPELLDGVLARLAAVGADPELVLDLAGASAGRSATGASDWKPILVDQLVERGDVATAFRLWQRFSGVSGQTGTQGLYDGAFTGRPGFPPFNWRLAARPDGVAERATGGGLQATYYGREATELATQLLMLRPGRYRIQFSAEGDASGEGSRLVWRLRCHRTQANLMELPIKKISSTPDVLRAEFTVPSSCAAQWLTLAGVPAEFPSEQNVLIRDLAITGGGS